MRARLRTLSKDNAQQVGLHLVMTGRLLDSDPELAYEHAQAAVRRAGRVDVVREAAGLAAYRTGRFAEALRELRTVRRLNGSSEHLAVMADCERGLGRPERALALATSEEAEGLEADVQLELAMVVSGARLDLGEPEAALATLSGGAVTAAPRDGVVAARLAQARAAALEALGRHDDAAAELARFSAADLASAAGEVEEDVVVFDLEEDADAESQPVESQPVDAQPADVQPADAQPVEDMDADDQVAGNGDHDDAGMGGELPADDPVGAEEVEHAADDLAQAQSEDADVETPSPAGAERAEAGSAAPDPGTSSDDGGDRA